MGDRACFRAVVFGDRVTDDALKLIDNEVLAKRRCYRLADRRRRPGYA